MKLHASVAGVAAQASLLLLLTGPVAAALASPHRVSVHASLPELVRRGEAQLTTGTVRGASRGALAELQSRAGARRWSVQATAPLKRGRFTLHWAAAAQDSQIRVALVRRGRVIAATATSIVLVGPAPLYCAAAPAPTVVPAGDGVIEGGVYINGGPAPGLHACQGTAGTLSVYPAGEAPAAGAPALLSVPLTAGEGYAFAMPAGEYVLREDGCLGSATVTAGALVTAETSCDVP